MAATPSSPSNAIPQQTLTSMASGETEPDERMATKLLRVSFRHLVVQGGFLDTQSEKGFLACQTFLRAAEICSEAMSLEPAARNYRDHFSRHFRGLFEGHARSYRVDVLEAGTSRGLVVWANGERVQLSQALATDAEALREAWISLGHFLSRWDRQAKQEADDPSALAELRLGLARLDFAWAAFECAYIAELMRLQERGRLLLRKAVDYERRLRVLEENSSSQATLLESQDYQALQHKLVSCLERLNVLANVQRRGRFRLTSEVLGVALKVLEPRCHNCPARVLAEQVVASYIEMREYLSEVGRRLHKVDPDLWRNADLVDQLRRWEETWEVGALYLAEPRQFHATCDVVACLREVVKAAPELARMCEDRDPELFLVLPRAVLLAFLAAPHGPRAALLRRLLPRSFSPREEDAEATAPWGPGPELQALAARFEEALDRMRVAVQCETEAWRLLLRRAVCGAESAQPTTCTDEAAAANANEAADGLLHELEGWSMELQRCSTHGRTPEDWNKCSDVLVQCLLSAAGVSAAAQALQCADEQ